MKVPDDLDFNSQDSLKKNLLMNYYNNKKHYYTDITCEAVRVQEKLFTFKQTKCNLCPKKIDHTCEEVRVQAKLEADHIARLIISHARNVRRRKTSTPFTYNY